MITDIEITTISLHGTHLKYSEVKSKCKLVVDGFRFQTSVLALKFSNAVIFVMPYIKNACCQIMITGENILMCLVFSAYGDSY